MRAPGRRRGRRRLTGAGVAALLAAGLCGCSFSGPGAASSTASRTGEAHASATAGMGDSAQVGATGGASARTTSVPSSSSSSADSLSSSTGAAPGSGSAGVLHSPACPDPASMPLRARLAQLLMVGIDRPSRTELAYLTDPAHPVGAVFLTGDATTILTDGSLARFARTVPATEVAVDDEGGRVQRIDAVVGNLPAARTLAATVSPARVQQLARQRGQELARLGITMDLAPDVDVSAQPRNDVIGDRSFSDDPAVVVRYAGAFAQGLRQAGVLPTLKHFPGHGHAVGDSHLGRAVTPPLAVLRGEDWRPFAELPAAGPVAVMVGHLQVPGLSTGTLPSSLDPAVYRALREQLGFAGLVVTDELAGMAAVTQRYGLAAAVPMALSAGADQALFNVPRGEVRARLQAVLDAALVAVRQGRLSQARVDAALRVVLTTKGC